MLRNHTAHTCDGEQLLIICPRKTTISILGAFYGRRVPSPNLCPSPGNASQENIECTSTTAHLVGAEGSTGQVCTLLLPTPLSCLCGSTASLCPLLGLQQNPFPSDSKPSSMPLLMGKRNMEMKSNKS